MSDNIPPTRIFNNFNFHTNCFSKSYILWKPWLKTKRWAQSKQNCKSNYRDPNSGSWTADLRRKTVSVILSLFTECTENDCNLLKNVQHCIGTHSAPGAPDFSESFTLIRSEYWWHFKTMSIQIYIYNFTFKSIPIFKSSLLTPMEMNQQKLIENSPRNVFQSIL